jgi:hypothetical protein
MLEEKDLRAISALLKEELKTTENRLTEQFDEKIAEVLSAVNEGFSGLQEQINEIKTDTTDLKDEMTKRPTRDEMFSWADRRITDLEIAKERHDYMHMKELKDLPTPAEINKTLIEQGFKQKLA